MWDYIQNNLPLVLPLCLPIAFLLMNAILKWLMDILNPHLLGADLALCGLSLLSGTLLRRISLGNLDKMTGGTAFVMLVICLFFWVGCLLLGRPKSAFLSTIS